MRIFSPNPKPTSYKLSAISGQLAIQVLLFGFISILLISGFVLWSDTYVKSVSRDQYKSLAFTIAESGIEYYRWHLAHSPQDFKDGTTTSSQPYIHVYSDKDGNRLGQFELQITTPASGTTITTITSTGRVDSDPTAYKVIKVKMGLPSLARYSVAANADIRFGEGTDVYGQLHSNGGIRFDGVAHNVISSAKDKYDDPDHSGGQEFGVHTHSGTVDPLPPAAVPTRTDVFMAGRSFPVPAVDFNGITTDLANIKTAASSAGYYKGPSGSKGYGYEIVLKTNDTFDVYKVTGLKAAPNNCNSDGSAGWGTWSINTTSSVATNVAFPANGLLFFEDDIWVRGKINGARLTIASGRFPVSSNTYADITINSDLLYTNYDGQDTISLMTQGNINAALKSDDDLEIDAALVAQNGRIGRYYYSSSCGTEYKRSKITLYGMLATNQRYGFAYTDGTGYNTRIITYDGNLLYGPPPSFPITASQYDIISWEEVR